MGKRPRKKVVLFLIEGDSERYALEDRIAELYDEIDESLEVRFPEIVQSSDNPDDLTEKVETGGDITQFWDVYERNYDDKIYEYFLRDYFDVEHLLPKDIVEVIQLVDLDGAYIKDQLITSYGDPEDPRKPTYNENGIVCRNPQSLSRRHDRKRKNLNYLKDKHSIKIQTRTVDFSVFYFSCNLDHFLHNEANLDGRDKTTAARDFSDGFIGDPEGFSHFFINDPASANNKSYEESWDLISQEDSLESLHRHTNIDILLRKLLNEIQ